VQYAWTAAVFCVILAYSVACPLITPIGKEFLFCLIKNESLILGLIFMILKRAVDKYNLVFVYDTEIADKSVHRLAGNFIIIALIIQQLTLLFFVLVRSGWLIENENFIFQKFRILFLRNINLFIDDIIGKFYFNM
jgi:hypothetical protein